MKLFTTTDVAASVRKAYGEFTHIVLNRGYTTIKPVFFMSKTIADLPIYQFASWLGDPGSQVSRWENRGGVLIEQDTHPKRELKPDVTVMVECPYDTQRIDACHKRNAEYGVIPHPMAWRTHEQCLDLRHPPVDLLEAIWRVCGGKEMTNAELAADTGLPVLELQYVKNSLKPSEVWYVQKRLAPEREEFIPVWDWLEGGPVTKRAISEARYKGQVEEMARFGYIGLKKIHCYPVDEPDWKVLKKKRETALSELAAVRSLVDSLPDHLAE